jgi:type IV pilus assembly protein PilM
MPKKLNSVLGIDIGSRKIKVAEVRTQGKEPVVSALGMIDTPEGAVDHTGVYNSDAVGAALKQVLNEAGASVSHAVVSVAGQASVLVRTLEVPKMNPSELKDHMQWEINRNIPFAESTVMSDFRPLGDDDPNSQNMDVVMAISPQSAIDTIMACVKKAGKQMAAIDVEPLGIARSLTVSYDDEFQAKTVCVIDIGHKTTSINIYRGGKLLMPRQVPIGGEMFTRALSDAMNLGMEESELVKVTKCDVQDLAGGGGMAADPFASPFMPASPDAGPGQTQEFVPYNPFSDEPAPGAAPYNPFAEDPGATPATPPTPSFDEPQPPIGDATSASPYGDSDLPFGGFDEPQPAPAPEMIGAAPVPARGGGDPETTAANTAILPVLEEFVAEVRRSIDYFRSRGGDVDQLVLCGGGGRLRGLPSFLEKSLGIACDSYDPLRRLNLSAKRVEPTFVDEHRQEFAVAVGNGLHIFFD